MRKAGYIDTHSHFQLAFGTALGDAQQAAAEAAGIECIVLCPGDAAGFELAKRAAHAWGYVYMLGIHPLAVPDVAPGDLALLRRVAAEAMDDPRFIGIGEVGLDGFEPGIDQKKAEDVFVECLKIARDLDLPLSIHARKSISRLLACFRRAAPAGGVVHAFNGSDAERDALLKHGLKLGFGGACTYDGSKRIRRHLAELPDDAWVIETDAPDMPSSSRRDRHAAGGCSLQTEPVDLLETAAAASALRGISLGAVASTTRANAIAAFPRLARALELN